MAKILIVDDHPANRDFLVTLLEYGGFALLEAADGAEGLAIARAERPDLIITDILMPTMDGFEFVRQLRADSAIEKTPVIFCTAQYHGPQAEKLARDCGVTSVLTKPCEPEVILQAVKAALGDVSVAVPSPKTEEFDREHLSLLTDKLSQKVDELERTNGRLTAMVELGLQLGSERDPGKLLQSFCDSARDILGSRFAVVGISMDGESRYKYLLQSGMNHAAASEVGRSGAMGGVLGSVLTAGRCVRIDRPGALSKLGFPASFPSVSSLLAAPIVSPSSVFGWVCLLDKLGEDSFSDEDEGLLRMLGAQVGRIYENGSLYADLLRHSTQLANEIAERKKSEWEVRKTANLLQAVVDGTTDAIFVKDNDGRYLLCNPAAGRFMSQPPSAVIGKLDTDFFDPQSARLLRDRDLQVMDGGASETQEEQLTVSGVTRTFLATKSPYKDASDKVIGMVGISRDITERKRSEERLRQSQLLLSEASRIGGMGAWAISFGEMAMTWSDELRAIYGLKRDDEPSLKRTLKLLAPSGRAKLLEAVAHCRGLGDPFDLEAQTDTFAGERLWARIIGQAVRNPQGKVIGMQGAFQNITDRKWAEKRLRTQHAVVNILAQSNGLADAAPKILQAICENTEWEIGDLWIVDRKADRLSLVEMWHVVGLDAAEFKHLSRKVPFRKGIGLPGRVWEHGQPVWLGDVSMDPNFPRAKAASKAGLRGAFGFPIRHGEETVGVVEFFSKDSRPPDRELLEVFRSLGTQIGQFIDTKRAERNLQLFRKLIDQTSDGIEVVEPLTGRYIDVNEKTCISHGYTREEFLNMRVADVDPNIASIQWGRFILEGRLSGHQTFESVHRRKDGSVFPIEVNFNTIRIDRDYMVAVVRDITERKRVEEKLRRFNQELEERVKLRTAQLDLRTREFETVVKSIPDTVIRVNRKKEIVFFKDSSPEEIPGIEGCSASDARCGNCFLCSVVDEIFRWLLESGTISVEIGPETVAMNAIGPGVIELEVSFGVIELRVTPLADGDLLVLARDISSRRKLEKEILNALNHEKNLSEMKTRFISVASHEFRTPMTAVSGAAELLQHYSEKLTPAKRVELLARIIAGANRLKAIVEDVLILSRADAAKLEVLKESVNLKSLFSDILEEAEVGDKKKHEFQLQCFGERELFLTDRKLLHHILSNFLSNAIRYSPEGSTIDLRLYREEQQFWFEVADQGIGIPEKDQQHLFEPFYRASNVGQISGTGLGLNIVKRYTELLGGSITLVSSSPSGTCFRVTIPGV